MWLPNASWIRIGVLAFLVTGVGLGVYTGVRRALGTKYVQEANQLRQEASAALADRDKFRALAEQKSEALQKAFAEKPDLLITDATMPKMDGFELIKKLRSSLETAVIPIVMLTARQDKASELKGLDVGADDYITKPFDIDKLLARIKMLLRRK